MQLTAEKWNFLESRAGRITAEGTLAGTADVGEAAEKSAIAFVRAKKNRAFVKHGGDLRIAMDIPKITNDGVIYIALGGQLTPARVTRFDKHFASFLALSQKYGETRWQKMKQTAPGDLFSLPREEFRKYAKVQCEMLDCVEGMLKVYGERNPPSDEIASKKATPHARKRELWEGYREVWEAACQQMKVLEENWDEWIAHGFQEDESLHKPWQKEVTRLNGVMADAQKRVDALLPGKK